MPQPAISVVVPTRNRPDHAEPCVRSVLQNDGDFELVVIDQSDADDTERALRAHASDRRFRHVRSHARGASAARNQGISETKHSLIAFTDDDCRVSPSWLSNITQIFADAPRVDIVFGRVVIPPHLQGKGFAAEFEPHQRIHQGSLPAVNVAWGIGANMSVRRSLFARLGGFDNLLGPGAPFNAAEEFDLMIRALTSGSTVLNASEVQVEHWGVREGADASKLMRGYGVSVGATLAKHARLGTPETRSLLLNWLAHFGLTGLRNVVSGKRPSGLGLVAGMLRGVYLSSSHPIDANTSVYRG